ARRATRASWTVRAAWLRPALILPVAIVSDAAQVLAGALRPNGAGRFVSVPTGPVGDGTVGRSRRAVATFFMSCTPGSYVLDTDPDSGDLLVHELATGGPRIEHHL